MTRRNGVIGGPRAGGKLRRPVTKINYPAPTPVLSGDISPPTVVIVSSIEETKTVEEFVQVQEEPKIVEEPAVLPVVEEVEKAKDIVSEEVKETISGSTLEAEPEIEVEVKVEEPKEQEYIVEQEVVFGFEEKKPVEEYVESKKKKRGKKKKWLTEAF